MTEILKFNSEVPGQVGKLMSRLTQLPRATRYQDLCRRIADRALDLRVPEWHGNPTIAGRQLRQCEHLWTAGVLHDWILEAARLDELAAMVILDAADLVAEWLDLMAPDQNGDYYFLGAAFKREFTQIIGGTPFLFRIPMGWELSLNHRQFDEGNYGVGEVVRCHLSESTTHLNWAWGDLVGKGRSNYTDLGYFGVPCRIAPSFQRTPIDVDDDRWRMPGVTGTIPVQWITHTRDWKESDKTYLLKPVADDDAILDVGRRAVEAVTARQEEVAQKMRDARSSQT